jgi:NADH-quinone oxidoreductase subunit E
MIATSELTARVQEIIARYPEGRSRSALLPLLHLVQAEEGCVTAEGIAFCAEVLGLTRAEVSAVATFYTMYKRRPAGDWLVSVCTNTMCDVLGGGRVYEMLSEYLDVGHDETTADGTITLEHAECLAACDYGPVLTVNYEFFDKVDVETALGIVTALQSGERPRPSRGARLCTLKEMSLQLAGLAGTNGDGWESTGVADGVAGDPTLRTNHLAERHGISVADFDPDTPIGRQYDSAPPATVPEANKPASDRKPAGDSPMPQQDKLKEAGA